MDSLILILVAGAFYFAFYWNIMRDEPKIKTRNYYLICSLCDLGLIGGCIYILGKVDIFKFSTFILYVIYATILYEFYLSIKSLIRYLRFKENNIKEGLKNENN